MSKPFVVQVVGYKNTGKTTLVCKLVEGLVREGLEVGTVKHDAHFFEIDHEGKDTWRHREAGSRIVAISSERMDRTCFIEQRYTPLDGILKRMSGMDVVVVEGYKAEGYPKIVLVRKPGDAELLLKVAPVLAVGSWLPEQELRARVMELLQERVQDQAQDQVQVQELDHAQFQVSFHEAPICHIDDAEGLLQLILAAKPR